MDGYGYRVQNAYTKIMGEVGYWLNDQEKHRVAEILDEMDTQAEADLY